MNWNAGGNSSNDRMVVILILGSNATPPTNNPQQRSLVSPQVSFDIRGPSYQRHYVRSISANPTFTGSSKNGYCHQTLSPRGDTSIDGRTKYKSLSVPQLPLGQRFYVGDNRKSHPSPAESTKANQKLYHQAVNAGGGDETPLIRHITRVNICDASSQSDLAASNNGAITDAEPVTREGKYHGGDINYSLMNSGSPLPPSP